MEFPSPSPSPFRDCRGGQEKESAFIKQETIHFDSMIISLFFYNFTNLNLTYQHDPVPQRKD